MKTFKIRNTDSEWSRLLLLVGASSTLTDSELTWQTTPISTEQVRARLATLARMEPSASYKPNEIFLVRVALALLEEKVWPDTSYIKSHPKQVELTDESVELVLSWLRDQIGSLRVKLEKADSAPTPDRTQIQRLDVERRKIYETAQEMLMVLDREGEVSALLGELDFFANGNVRRLTQIAGELHLQLQSYGNGIDKLAEDQKVPALRSALKAVRRDLERLATCWMEYDKAPSRVLPPADGTVEGTVHYLETLLAETRDRQAAGEGQGRQLVHMALSDQVTRLEGLMVNLRSVAPNLVSTSEAGV